MTGRASGNAVARMDLAMIVLRRAREDARAQRFTERRTVSPRRRRGRTPPVHIAQALLDLFAWTEAPPLPAWASVAGPLARHVNPTAFDRHSGTLTLACDSTAWATQTRHLAPALVARLNEELGPGTVRQIRVVKTASSAPLPPFPVEEGRCRRSPQRLTPTPDPDPVVRAALERQNGQLPREVPPFTHRG